MPSLPSISFESESILCTYPFISILRSLHNVLLHRHPQSWCDLPILYGLSPVPPVSYWSDCGLDSHFCVPNSGLDAFTPATYITSTLSATLSFVINLLVLLLVDNWPNIPHYCHLSSTCLSSYFCVYNTVVIHHSRSVQLSLVGPMPSIFHYLCGSSVVITYPSTPVQLSLVIYISILLYLCPYRCCHLTLHPHTAITCLINCVLSFYFCVWHPICHLSRQLCYQLSPFWPTAVYPLTSVTLMLPPPIPPHPPTVVT